MASDLYLASTSPYRAALMRRLGLPFSVEAPGIEESPVAGEAPAARALRLAGAKAAAVSARHPSVWVLGSDQVADCGGLILEKPGDARRSREQLRASSGRSVHFHTAVVLRRDTPAASHEHLDLTVVSFRSLDDDQIARYVERDRPFDCAGGFRSEGAGIALFERVDSSDPTALIGLPLIWVAQALAGVGFDLFAAVQR
ncbi:MAG: Maf family protein [Steroidobacteraceae bacterium]